MTTGKARKSLKEEFPDMTLDDLDWTLLDIVQTCLEPDGAQHYDECVVVDYYEEVLGQIFKIQLEFYTVDGGLMYARGRLGVTIDKKCPDCLASFHDLNNSLNLARAVFTAGLFWKDL